MTSLTFDFYYLVPTRRYIEIYYNEGLAVLSAMAKAAGHEVRLHKIDYDDYCNKTYSIDKSSDFHCVSFASLQFSLAKDIIAELDRQRERGSIVVGGIHATVDRESVFELPQVDAVVSGEGEAAFARLLGTGRLESLAGPNVMVRGRPHGPLGKTEFADLDTLPFPDRSIFSRKHIQGMPEFIFSRGCPFSCAYCSNEFLNGTFGLKIRKKSPAYCMAEIESTISQYDISDDTVLTIHDDVFLNDINWLYEFANLYKKNFKNKFRCNSTATLINEEKLKILKEIHCCELWIGIETGNEELRRQILNKKISNAQIIKAFQMVHDYGIAGVSFNMMGLPGETVKTIEDTLDLNRKCKLKHTQVAKYTPLPGTSLYEKSKREGLIRELTDEQKGFGIAVFGLNNPVLTFRELHYYTILLYNYAKRQDVQYLYMKIFKHLMCSDKYWPIAWRLFGYVNKLFPDKNIGTQSRK